MFLSTAAFFARNGERSTMGRQGHDAATAPGIRIQRSQSKLSLSASFEALAVYFPCMNSFDEEDEGKRRR